MTNTSRIMFNTQFNGIPKEYDEDEYKTYYIDEKLNSNGIYSIKKGDRIAQIVLCKFENIKLKLADEGTIKNIGINRGGGFGHSGTK